MGFSPDRPPPGMLTLEKLAISKQELKTASVVRMEVSLEKVPSSGLCTAVLEQTGMGARVVCDSRDQSQKSGYWGVRSWY